MRGVKRNFYACAWRAWAFSARDVGRRPRGLRRLRKRTATRIVHLGIALFSRQRRARGTSGVVVAQQAPANGGAGIVSILRARADWPPMLRVRPVCVITAPQRPASSSYLGIA